MKTKIGRMFGLSRLETAFIAVLFAILGILAVTRYLELSITAKQSMDIGVINAVRQGISSYAEQSRERGNTSVYPAVLDDADTGVATAQNRFFGYVLEQGLAVKGWSKTANNQYHAPNGEQIVYDPQTGEFMATGAKASKDATHSDRIDPSGPVKQ